MTSYTWNNANQGNWTTFENWTPNGVPGSGDDVTISEGEPTITSNVNGVNSVDIEPGSNGFASLIVQDGSLGTTGNFTENSETFIDQNSGGGSTLNVGGALSVGNADTYQAELVVGNANLTANDTVTAQSLSLGNFSSVLQLLGNGNGGPQVTMTVAGRAGFGAPGVLTGDVYLENSVLQFGSGAITAIAASSGLTMDGGSIADQGTTGNTALDLTQISSLGVLSLSDGATAETATSTGSLVNSGTLSLLSGAFAVSYIVDGSLTNNGTNGVEGISVYGGGGTATLTVKGNFISSGNPNSTSSSNLAGTTLSGYASASGIASLVIGGTTTGAGTILMEGYSSIEFGNASDNSLALSSASNSIKLDNPAAGYTGSVTGFAKGDTLDLAGETASIQSYNGSTLVVRTSTGTTQSYALSGPAANGLEAVGDGDGGTDVVVCFTSGTCIRTARGCGSVDVAVEDLRIGDLVVTAAGAKRSIRWLGHRTIDRPSFEQNPVRIRTGAFGVGRPERDLFLSPGHPVLVDEAEHDGDCLVPIMCLINGTTIERFPVERVTYWHVELDQHDILLAEGLPAESYIDLGSRVWFDGIDGPLHDPDVVTPGVGRCQPVAIDGPIIEAERRRLDAVFAATLTAQCGWGADRFDWMAV